MSSLLCLPEQLTRLHSQDATATLADLQGPFQAGACGYGQLPPTEWPGLAVASVSADNPITQHLSSSGCGACIELKCTGVVRSSLLTWQIILSSSWGRLLMRPVAGLQQWQWRQRAFSCDLDCGQLLQLQCH